MTKPTKHSAILLAAGRGTRYHGRKQDVPFHGMPLWRWAFGAVASVVGDDRVVVVGRDVPGGDKRSGSVLNGLKALPADTDRVVIAEAARPMVTEAQIRELLDDSHPSTTFVRPLVNTVIYRDGTYVDRNLLYDLLTPQAFDYKALRVAYESGRFEDMTDETRVMWEAHGIKPHFIEVADDGLFKVTYPGDLEIIESIYRRQIEEGTRDE